MNQKPTAVRQANANVIHPSVGLLPKSKSIKWEEEAFGLFITGEILYIILEYTNAKVTQVISKSLTHFNENGLYLFAKHVDIVIMKGSIALLLY